MDLTTVANEQPEIKYLPIRELMSLGILQEVNRQFFHPLGLALEVTISDDEEITEPYISGVWDYRDDPEGITYGENIIDRKKIERVYELYLAHAEERVKKFGWVVQPASKE